MTKLRCHSLPIFHRRRVSQGISEFCQFSSQRKRHSLAIFDRKEISHVGAVKIACNPKELRNFGALRFGKEEHSMDRCRCRAELSERFGGHWSNEFQGKYVWTNFLVPCFQGKSVWSVGPTALKVRQKFPRDGHWSMDGSSRFGKVCWCGLQVGHSGPQHV